MVAFRVRGFHPLRQAVPDLSPAHHALRRRFRTAVRSPYNTDQATLRSLALDGFGLFPFRSSLLRESRILISFPRLLRYFNSAGVRPCKKGHRGFTSMGSPIRASTGVAPVDGSPWLFAVFRALLRTYGPRYPLRAVHVSNVRFPSRGERGFPPSPTHAPWAESGRRLSPVSGGRSSFGSVLPLRIGMDAAGPFRDPENSKNSRRSSDALFLPYFLVQMLKEAELLASDAPEGHDPFCPLGKNSSDDSRR